MYTRCTVWNVTIKNIFSENGPEAIFRCSIYFPLELERDIPVVVVVGGGEGRGGAVSHKERTGAKKVGLVPLRVFDLKMFL